MKKAREASCQPHSISYTYRERSKVKWDSKKTPRFNLQYWEGWGEPDSAMIGLG